MTHAVLNRVKFITFFERAAKKHANSAKKICAKRILRNLKILGKLQHSLQFKISGNKMSASSPS